MQAQGSRISKVQIQGAIGGPQMGGDLTSSGFQNNLYDNFLCFPSWTCGIFLPCYSASCHCDKLWETQYKGGQGSLGMRSEPQVSWAHYLSPRGEANTTQCWRPVTQKPFASWLSGNRNTGSGWGSGMLQRHNPNDLLAST